MQLIRSIAAAALVLAIGGGSLPAMAASCTLVVLNSDGAFGDPTHADTQLSSEDPGGRSVTFTAVSLFGTSNVSIAAPTAVYTGPHPHAGDTPSVRYTATSTLGTTVSAQGYTGLTTGFPVTTGNLTVTTVLNAQIVNPAGFPQGNYELHTVVTCL